MLEKHSDQVQNEVQCLPIPLDSVPIFKDFYIWMLRSRAIDELEAEIVARGEAFFHVASAGHESMVVLNDHLTESDWLCCHYRDRALMLARGIPSESFFHALYATEESPSKGRQMNAHMSDADKKILSIVGPVGNHALHAAGIAMEVKEKNGSPIVLCAMGDGTSQQGEVLEAIAETVRWNLPVLFLIEDNSWSISTPTRGKTFFSLPEKEVGQYYDLPIHRFDGRDAVACWSGLGEVVSHVRSSRGPAIVVVSMPRLSSHTNADDQRVYRNQYEIDRQLKEDDPIQWLSVALQRVGISEKELSDLQSRVDIQVIKAEESVLGTPDPLPAYTAIPPIPDALNSQTEYLGDLEDANRLTMLEALRGVLRDRLKHDERVFLYGEDIEDPKGDVFGLTKGLSSDYPSRVINSPLAESSIVGTSIGRALAGGRPVAFLQFADFLPIAFNQLISELGTIYWRTDGTWRCPVIVMITCGGYRPGLGPFHAQTLEAIAAHTPGVDVVMPSSAADAAGLLNAAFVSERPTLFFYPKSCLNDRSATTSAGDLRRQVVLPGRGRILRDGEALTLVSWGNGVSRCLQAATELSKCQYGYECEVIDLRSLAPWDEQLVLASASKTGRLLVVHEDNRSCGMGAEVIATIAEKSDHPIKMARLTRENTYIPFNFSNQLEILPSYKRTIEVAAALLDCDVTWQSRNSTEEDGLVELEAIGNSPSDESVIVSEWQVEIGEKIQVGDLIVDFEADKAIGEMLSPYEGVVIELLAEEGEIIKVGSPLLKMRVNQKKKTRQKPLTREPDLIPVLSKRDVSPAEDLSMLGRSIDIKVGLLGVGTALGSQSMKSISMTDRWEDRYKGEIEQLTGIENRYHVSEREGVRDLAVQAVEDVLNKTGVDFSKIDLVVCSSGTPEVMTPSLACQILSSLGSETQQCPAFDISAACSGYVYGLQTVNDFLVSNGGGTALLVTSEVLSPLLNEEDFNTSIIFGDAATATLLCAGQEIKDCRYSLERPVISGEGSEKVIQVPLKSSGSHVSMDGAKVFSKGVKKMSEMLRVVCSKKGIDVSDLDLVVPHQANRRLIDAMGQRLGLNPDQIYCNIERYGNTSSSTIPLCLAEIWNDLPEKSKIGITALGGGLTFGAAILNREE